MNKWMFLSVATVCYTTVYLVELFVNPDRPEEN